MIPGLRNSCCTYVLKLDFVAVTCLWAISFIYSGIQSEREKDITTVDWHPSDGLEASIQRIGPEPSYVRGLVLNEFRSNSTTLACAIRSNVFVDPNAANR